ncbi:AI-2E family transporter [Solidesulfovibrio sp.]
MPPGHNTRRLRLLAWMFLPLLPGLLGFAAVTGAVLAHLATAGLDGSLRTDLAQVETCLGRAGEEPLRERLLQCQGDGSLRDNTGPWLEILDPTDGEVLRPTLDGAAPTPPAPPLTRAAGEHFRTVTTAPPPLPATLRQLEKTVELPDGRTALVRIARNGEGLHREERAVVIALALGLPAALVLCAVAGWFAAARLPAPVPAPARAERLRDCTEDLAHGLRTPLTAIVHLGEVGLQTAATADDLRASIAAMLDETRRITTMTDAVLTLARSESGRIQPVFARVELGEIATDAAELLRVLAEERGQTLVVTAGPDSAVAGDRDILRQALINLIDNAIKYGPPASAIAIDIQRTAEAVTVDVADAGPGIPAGEREAVFERFYRVRADSAPVPAGTGLGLATVQRAATVHGGSAVILDRPGGGCVVRLSLPPAPGTGGEPDGPDAGIPEANDVGPLHARFYRPFLLLVFIAAVAAMGALLWPFRHAIVLSVILALLLAPLRKRTLAVLQGARLTTAALLTVATLVFIVLPSAVLAVVLASKAGTFIEAGVQWFTEGGLPSLLNWLQSLDLPDWLQGIADMVPIDPQSLKTGLLGTAGAAGKQLLAIGRGFAGQMAGFVAQIIMLLLFLFYFLAEAERVVRGLRRLSPLRRWQEQELAGRLKLVTRSILVGGIAAGLSQGLATTLGLWLVGIAPLFWGMVAMLASLVPVIGLALIHIPFIIYLFATGATGKAVFLLIWWLAVVSTVDNLVRPFFISGSAQLPLLMIFVAIVGGVLLFGPLGLIYGPVAMSLCLVVFQLFIEAQSKEPRL